MLPRTITKISGRVRGRLPSPYGGRRLCLSCTETPPPRWQHNVSSICCPTDRDIADRARSNRSADGIDRLMRSSSGRGLGVKRAIIGNPTCRQSCCFATRASTPAASAAPARPKVVRMGAAPDPMFATGRVDPYSEHAAGLRPENSPASTPANVGCKAYYTARNIDIEEACNAMYAPFPRSYEKHCVVVGPIDPACFDGLTRRGSVTSNSAGGALPSVRKWLRPIPPGALTSKRGGRGAESPRLRPADVAFAGDDFPFLVSGYGGRAQGWEMWDPAGTRARRLRGDPGCASSGADDIESSYVVMFDYGSVVFLHFTQQQQEAHLQELRAHVAKQDRISRSRMKMETHDVVLWSGLPEPARLEPDCTTLRALDVNLLTIIGTVLGQTVALDHYADLVDTMMGRFVSINSGVEQTGKFTAAQKKELFQLVARNNTVSTDVVSKLGILERSEAAWKDKDYNFVWEGLREEFELDSRFRKIEFKLNMLQQNTNFFIEMLHNQKSTMLEWTIIVLITAEIVVGVCDLMNFRPFT